MKTTLVVIQIILSIFLTVLIFLQNNNSESRSNILSSTTVEKRGWEKIMFNFTIFIIILFLISSIIQTIL